MYIPKRVMFLGDDSHVNFETTAGESGAGTVTCVRKKHNMKGVITSLAVGIVVPFHTSAFVLYNSLAIIIF